MKKNTVIRMKKNCIMAVMIGLAATNVIGCGKEEPVNQQKEEVAIESSVETPVDIPVETPIEEGEKEEDIKVVDFEKSEKATVWKSVTTKVTDRWIQIDEAMFAPGKSVAETVNKIMSTEIIYENNYVEDKLVSANENASVIFTRDGFEWFTLHTANGFGETKSIKDLPVTGVTISEEAKPYVYFGAGFSGEEVLGMSYNDIKSACEAGFKDWIYKEETVWRNEADCLAMSYYSPYEFATLPNADWTGYEILVGEISYTFFIDSNTGKVVDFDANNGFGEAIWNKLPEVVEESVSDNSVSANDISENVEEIENESLK